MAVTAVVLDIEGTVGSTSFVVDTLYPYSRERFAAWIGEHPDDPDTARAVAQVRELAGRPDAGTEEVVEVLNAWLDADQKITPLKTLQGMIWARGFAAGELVSHFYDDVVPALRAWHAAGLRLYVFSSGSVSAQQAYFRHSPAGDLLPLLSGHFDTENAGPKKDPASYRAITAAVGAPPSATVFLSDVAAELDAARAAGWHTVGVRRKGEPYYDAGAGDHPAIGSFADLDLTGPRAPAVTGAP